MSGFAPTDDMQRIIEQMVQNGDRPGAPAYGDGAPDGSPGPGPAGVPESAPPAPPTHPFPPEGEPSGFAPPQVPDPSIAAPTPGAPPPPAAAPEPDVLTLPDGSTIGRDDLQRIIGVGADRLQELALLDHAFRTRPDVHEAVQRAVNAGGLLPSAPPAPPTALPPSVPPPPSPTGTGYPPAPVGSPVAPSSVPPPPALPSDVDPEDPTVRWVLSQRAELEARIGQQQQFLAQQQQAALTSSLSRARADSRSKYPNLTVDDWARLEQYATEMGFASGHFQRHGDFYEAARFALETAAETMPDQSIRSRLSSRPATSATDRQRQQALTALAGTGAPSPRTDQPQQVTTMSREQRVAGMARELEAYAQGLAPS